MGPKRAGRNSKKDGAHTCVRPRDQRTIHVNRGNPSRDLASAEPAGLAPAETDTPAQSMRTADPASVQIGTLPHSAHSAGGCGGLRSPWEALCPDVRRIILSKVPLRSLAPAAATCREFRGEFCRRLGEEQERLIAVAEETYGKDRLSASLKSMQQSICGLAPDHGIVMGRDQYLLIHAAGEPELASAEVLRGHLCKGWTAYFRRPCPSWGLHIMMRSCMKRSGCKCLGVRLDSGGRLEAFAWADEADVGMLLALCTRKPEPTPPHWERASKTIPVVVNEGLHSGKVKSVFKGPLGLLAETFFLYDL